MVAISQTWRTTEIDNHLQSFHQKGLAC